MAETKNTSDTTTTEDKPKIEFYLTESLKQRARIQMAKRGFANLSEYMRALIREDEPEDPDSAGE